MNAQLLNAFRTRITRVFPEQLRAAVEPLDEQELWWRPNESSNSIGNLILHLTGSLNHFLNRNLGGIAFDRDRDAEFAARGNASKAEVLAQFDAMVADAERTFDALTPDRLGEPSPEPGMHRIIGEDLVNVTAHLATHVGQIVWIAKMLHEGSMNEIWKRSHRAGGAWQPKEAK